MKDKRMFNNVKLSHQYTLDACKPKNGFCKTNCSHLKSCFNNILCNLKYAFPDDLIAHYCAKVLCLSHLRN